MTEVDYQTIIFAIAGGLGPVLLWVWFWLREDSQKPEPWSLIILAFLGGAVSVGLILPIQNHIGMIIFDPIHIFIFTAVSEELVKLLAIAFIAFKGNMLDEPTDYAIYLIIGALGFSATENILYLITPLQNNDVMISLLTSNFRFLGASVLHAVSSGTLGLVMGLAFYQGWFSRAIHFVFGFALAVTLHTLFNFFIIGSDQNIFLVLGVLWVVTVFVLLLFEKVKVLKPHRIINNPMRIQ